MKDFFNLDYLIRGNEKQKKVFEIIKNLKIFSILKKYKPILVGTIPINIDIETSDIDIICEVYKFERYIKIINENFSYYNTFNIYKRNPNTLLVRFEYDNFQVEIFAESLEITEQFGYRHMIIEYRLLNLFNEDFRLSIIDLKKQGYKTEKAFCELLNIKGNPFIKLLELENFNDLELIKLTGNKYQK